MPETLCSTGVQLPERWIDNFDDVADTNDVTRSAVIRALIAAGIRAYNENPSTVEFEDFQRPTIAERRARHSTD